MIHDNDDTSAFTTYELLVVLAFDWFYFSLPAVIDKDNTATATATAATDDEEDEEDDEAVISSFPS